jgi:hypothetical protein
MVMVFVPLDKKLESEEQGATYSPNHNLGRTHIAFCISHGKTSSWSQQNENKQRNNQSDGHGIRSLWD